MRLGIGDRVIWLKANPEGWAGNGKGVVADYEQARRHFEGTARGDKDNPSTGPAVGILLDGGDPSRDKKFDIWVKPSSEEIALDPDFPKEMDS